MNFNELMQKMRDLDQPAGSETIIDECGMMPEMDPISSAPKQQDNVTMNISMNGSGAGGIRDLMDILSNLDNNDNSEEDELGAMIGHMSANDEQSGPEELIDMDEAGAAGFDHASTEPDEMYGTVGDVTPTGNDMHSKGGEAEKVNGGGNPYGVDEAALVARLGNLYETIKNR